MLRYPHLLILVALVTTLAAAGCSNDDTQAAGAESQAAVAVVQASEAVPMLAERRVIDVRTPSEFAAGHIVDAVNVDVQAPDFSSRIKSFDLDAPYLLYCRSGRRSAMAAEIMTKAGFTDIVDAGAFEALMASGAPVE